MNRLISVWCMSLGRVLLLDPSDFHRRWSLFLFQGGMAWVWEPSWWPFLGRQILLADLFSIQMVALSLSIVGVVRICWKSFQYIEIDMPSFGWMIQALPCSWDIPFLEWLWSCWRLVVNLCRWSYDHEILGKVYQIRISRSLGYNVMDCESL